MRQQVVRKHIQVDWLSHLLQIVRVTGQLEVRCAYGAPWRIVWSQAAANEIPYHVIVKGRAIFEDAETRTARELVSGDIVLLTHGAAHVLHDGSGQAPIRTREHRRSAGWMLSENDGKGEQLDLMCGRFFIAPPHDRLIRNYMPANLVTRAKDGREDDEIGSASSELANLVSLMRMESSGDRAGGRAMLNALSSALFTLVLRAANEGESTRRVVGSGRPSAAGSSHCGDVRRANAGLGNCLIWRTCAACRARRS